VTEIPVEWRPKIERPYGKGTIMAIAIYATWNLLVNLASISDAAALNQGVQEALESAGPGLGPEASFAVVLLQAFLVFYVIDILVWFVIVILQYALAYGLSKPKRWARRAGMTALTLGFIMSLAMLLATIAVSRVVEGEMPSSVATQFVWNAAALLLGRRFLNKPEVRNYIKFEGREKTVPFMIEKEGKIPFMIEEEAKPKPTPPGEPEVRLADVSPVEKRIEEPVEEADTKHCRYCGARIPADSVYCEECGKRLI